MTGADDMNLGVSLYPDKTEFEQDKQYLEMAKRFGVTRVFMSFLQIDIQNPKKSVKRIKESARYAKAIGMEVDLDIHPMVFKYIGNDETDLSYFYEMGIHTLRLDAGYDGRTEAMMTHNPYGIHIEINMSRATHELEHILDYCPNRKQLRGSHNFYPQRYTGLSDEAFVHCSKRFLQENLHSAAFITSQDALISPWPVSEGLCTLENHRYLPLDIQLRHMKMMQLVDDVFIGNAFASEQELSSLTAVLQQPEDIIPIQLYECSAIEKKLLLDCKQEYRGDASSYVIRSTKHRMTAHKESIPALHAGEEIHKGDILLLNEQYGQYKGEIQIALCDRPGDPRINTVGKVQPEAMILVSQLRPFQAFRFQEVVDNEDIRRD